MFNKILFAALVAMVCANYAPGTLISFKSKECEQKAALTGAFLMGTSTKMYEGVGVMFVEMDKPEVVSLLNANTEFSDCVHLVE